MDHTSHQHQPLSPHPKLPDYLPLAVVLGTLLAATAALMAYTGFTLDNFLAYSMGLFFTTFAMFKLMDLQTFAHGYHEYDLIAKKFFAWGFAYPFIEATLGLLYLAGNDSPWLHIGTLVLVIITCISVGIKLAKREIVQCACLGSVLKVPITYVSLIEYALMGAMAAVMLTK